MRTLVIDVAAEYGGALTILNQFIADFQSDVENEYIVAIGKLRYENSKNVTFLPFPWVKRNYVNRIWFDNFTCRKLVKLYKPDIVLSLQNKGVSCREVEQHVYFQNILLISEHKFKMKESRSLWLAQKIISPLTIHSLKRVSLIIVQAEWIKERLSGFCKIEKSKIIVQTPRVDLCVYGIWSFKQEKILFYPANACVYKNHITLLKACKRLWETCDGNDKFKLVLTLSEDELPSECQRIIDGKKYPIEFAGRLDSSQMANMYSKSVLVFPSFLETVGMPLKEARIAEAPIIAADLPYAHESIGEYRKVSFFDYLNDFQLAETIKTVLKNYNL